MLLCWVLLSAIAATAVADGLNVASPIGFFTNVADRLLVNLAHEPAFRQEFGSRSVRVTNIMVWPTNDYTPAVHRTLQVTANLYDALTNHTPLTTNLSAPVVFRPLFRRDGLGNILIAGYREVVNADMAYSATAPAMVDLTQTNTHSSIPAAGTAFDLVEKNEPMVYGFPLVVGAKKGFPGFSTLALQTEVKVTRKLQLSRLSTSNVPNEICQLYFLGISNVLCVSAWNSYTNQYSRSVDIIGATDVTTVLTNEDGIIPTTFGTGLVSNRYSLGFITNVTANAWAGLYLGQPKYSFQIPLTNSFAVLTNATWQSSAPTSALGYFTPSNLVFNQEGLMPPQWWMNVKTRLRFIMVDTATSRILDYVNLSGDAETLNITQELMHGTDCSANPGNDNSAGGAWCTNKPPSYPPFAYVPPYGILNQLGVSEGAIPINNTWKSYIDDPSTGNDVQQSIQNFWSFMSGYPGTTNLIMQAPFSPSRRIFQYVSWQVNDPLVHYMTQDLIDLLGNTNTLEFVDQSNLAPKNSPVTAVGMVNYHYRPWGGNPYKSGVDTIPATAYHSELKDPLTKQSDKWDFPTNGWPNTGWLGQVHRGTPWQTIYLKSAPVDANTWQKWTGNLDDNDSALTQPQHDWQLASLLASLCNTNHPAQLLSPNNPDTNAWLGALDGMVVLPDAFNSTIMASNSPEAALIADAISLTRTHQSGGRFHLPGDILATPELSVASPWLSNTNLEYSGNTNINDAVCEAIPSQLLPLLRADSFGLITSSNGQSQLEFSGMDGFSYAVETSSNLVDWVGVSTNLPVNGRVSFTVPPAPDGTPQFYRSVIFP